MKRILSQSGEVTKVFHYSEHDDTAAIETIIETDLVIEKVKRMRELKRKKYDSDTVNYVGSVNTKLFLDWCAKRYISAQEALSDTKYLVMYLNDPDNAKFKAIDGKI